jgi:hypothetical protein
LDFFFLLSLLVWVKICQVRDFSSMIMIGGFIFVSTFSTSFERFCILFSVNRVLIGNNNCLINLSDFIKKKCQFSVSYRVHWKSLLPNNCYLKITFFLHFAPVEKTITCIANYKQAKLHQTRWAHILLKHEIILS